MNLAPAGASGNSIAKLGVISASLVTINNLGAGRSPSALALTGDITTTGTVDIDTSGDLTLASTGTEVKIIGGGAVTISVGGAFKDMAKQLGFYTSDGTTASTGNLNFSANIWTQTVTGSQKSIKTGGILTIGKTYSGAGNLWLKKQPWGSGCGGGRGHYLDCRQFWFYSEFD